MPYSTSGCVDCRRTWVREPAARSFVTSARRLQRRITGRRHIFRRFLSRSNGSDERRLLGVRRGEDLQTKGVHGFLAVRAARQRGELGRREGFLQEAKRQRDSRVPTSH